VQKSSLSFVYRVILRQFGVEYCLKFETPQPGGPCPRIYITQVHGDPVIPPGTGFFFRCLLRLAGLRWRYSNPPPHGVKLGLSLTLMSVSPSWNKAPIWGLRPDFYYCQTVAGLLMWGALSLSLWRENGSVVRSCCWSSPAKLFSGPSPVGLMTIFTVSDSRLPFSSPPTIRRATVRGIWTSLHKGINLV
jgi:hypothetical protein